LDRTGSKADTIIFVQEVVDIEESIWSTKFGIKGMVDISVTLGLGEPAPARQRQAGAA